MPDSQWTKLGHASVQVAEDGEILKGCPGLEGFNVNNLDETREQREQKQEQAEAAGWESKDTKDARAAWTTAKKNADDNAVILVRSGGRYFAFDEDAEVLRNVSNTGDGKKAEISRDTVDHQLKELAKSGYRAHISESSDPRPHDVTEQPNRQHPEVAEDHEEIEQASFDEAEFGTDDDQGTSFDDVPGQIGDAMRALMERPEAKRGEMVQANDMHEDYAQSLYEEMQQQTIQGDGHGEIHDLSDELGHGAMGYHCPHGVMSIQPPRFQEDGWDVRFAQSEEAQAEVQADPEMQADEPFAEPEQEPEPQIEPEPQPAPTRKPVRKTSRQQKYEEKTAKKQNEWFEKNAIPAEEQAYVKEIAKEAYPQRRDEAVEYNEMRRVLLSMMAGKNTGGYVGKLRSKEEGDQLTGFDEAVDYARNHYPQYLSGSQGNADNEETIVKQIMEGGFMQEVEAWDDDLMHDSLREFKSRGGMQAVDTIDPGKYELPEDFFYRKRYGQKMFAFDKPKEGDYRINRAGHKEVLRGGRWH